MTVNNTKRQPVWEPATPAQLRRLDRSGLDGSGLPADYFNPLPDPEDMGALSKQEASWLIEQTEGGKYPMPPPAQTLKELTARWSKRVSPEELREMKADWAALPSLGQMVIIRDGFLRLGWKHGRYADFLHRQAKVRQLRALTRQGANAVIVGLTETMKARN